MLTAIILLPFLAALGILLIPADCRLIVRVVALLATLVSMVLAVLLFLSFDAAPAGPGGFKFVSQTAWVPALGINFSVGVDGINVGLILMGAMVAFAAACVSWEIKTNDCDRQCLLWHSGAGSLRAH
jgi:NADH-quinone oxidoreductase subunit M